MNSKTAKKHAQTAHERRKANDFVKAGEYYTTTAYHYLNDWYKIHRGKKISQAEYFFLLAGTCYRIGDKPNCMDNRCQQGILIAEELLDRTENIGGSTAYDRARYAAWYEYIGDFYLVGNIDGATELYERAKQVYIDEDDPPLAHREQEHMWLTEFMEQILYGVNKDISDWRRFLREATLSEWIEFKKAHLPDALEALTSQSEWEMRGE